MFEFTQRGGIAQPLFIGEVARDQRALEQRTRNPSFEADAVFSRRFAQAADPGGDHGGERIRHVSIRTAWRAASQPSGHWRHNAVPIQRVAHLSLLDPEVAGCAAATPGRGGVCRYGVRLYLR